MNGSSRISVGAVLSVLLGLTGVPAILLGLRSLREINMSEGRLRGRGLAMAGMALGGLSTIVMAIGMMALAMVSLRGKDTRRRCENNLRQLGQALNLYHDTHGHFPAGTIPHPRLAVEDRWSWQAALVIYVDQNKPKQMSVTERWSTVGADIDTSTRWQDAANAGAVDAYLRSFVCPAYADIPPPTEPGATTYIGSAGVGPDSPWLPRDDPRAGVFGYDRYASREDITRGLSYTLAAAETTRDVGAWAAGGPTTVRGIAPDDLQPIGYQRAWGGLHPGGLNVLMADGAAQFRSESMAPSVFVQMAAIRD
jgi:prepilin-type processing-associated H-X9-DG protein